MKKADPHRGGPVLTAGLPTDQAAGVLLETVASQ